MKDFNIAKYLKENHLGPHAILGGYVDLHALKEAEDLEGWEQADFGATENKELADRFAKVEKTGNPNKDVKVVKIGKVYKVYTKDKEELKEKKMAKGKNSETITLSYYDYPSIDDDDQIFAVETFIKFVKSLGGNAKVIKDAFDDIEFKLTGISSEEVKKAYAKMVKAEDKKSISNPGPFNYLTSWTVNPPGLDEYNQLGEEEEMYLDTEIPYKGPERKVDGFGDKFKQTNAVEEAEGGSFNVSFMYADYPSISNAEQRLATMHLKKLVKSLGGIATITNDTFDTVDFNVTGISSFEELQNAYNDVVENEDDDYTMLPSWDIESPVAKGMNDDNSVNPFPSIMKEKEYNSKTGDRGWEYTDKDFPEMDKHNRMMGLIDQNIEPRLGQVKSVIDGAREQGYADRTIFTILARHPLVKNSIEALVDDGFEFQDIVDFFATDFSQTEEVTVSSSGVQMEKK
jgi:hypothetical protein